MELCLSSFAGKSLISITQCPARACDQVVKPKKKSDESRRIFVKPKQNSSKVLTHAESG